MTPTVNGKRHILIVAGDLSADRHAADLVQTLRRREPGLKVTARGGPSLKACADAFVYPLVGLGGFGFWEPVLKIPQLWKVRRMVINILTKDRPDLVIPVDYYGFNIHVARVAHARRIPVLYYISPQVWASRPGRIQKLRAAVDRMLVIFPFEKDIYQKADVPVTFVGHPLVDKIPATTLSFGPKRMGLMPGSRTGVIARHLPLLGEAAELLKKDFPNLECLLFRPAEMEPSIYQSFAARFPWIQIVSDPDYKVRQTLTLAITVSGTSSLENMLMGLPMVVMYRLSALTFEIAKRLIRVPFIGIPNILAGRAVVPERIQGQATPQELSRAAVALLRDEKSWSTMRSDLLALREGLRGNESTAAEEILKVLNTRNAEFLSPLPADGERASRTEGTGAGEGISSKLSNNMVVELHGEPLTSILSPTSGRGRRASL